MKTFITGAQASLQTVEPRKETELGLLPASWRVGPLGEFLSMAQYGASVKGASSGTYPILRMTNQVNGRISSANLQYAEVSERELENFRVQRGDILFNRTNSFELVGRTAIFDLEGDYVFASYLIRLRTLEAVLDPFFLNAYLNAHETQRRLKGIATRAVSQSNISASRLRTFVVPVPPIEEQRKIAAFLRVVQRAIEQQERMIAVITELKMTLMRRLFTTGLRGEPEKQTEIGIVPRSWEVAALGDYLTKAQYGISAKGSESGRYALLRMTNQRQGRVSSDSLQYANLTPDEFQRFRVERRDILFNRTNSFELVGRTAIFDLDGDFAFASYLIRLRTDSERLRPLFLNHYFSWEETQLRLKSIATRAVSQSNISATRLRGFLVPVPKTDEQDDIVENIDRLDQKLSVHARKHIVLTALFRILLHQLMTAQIRVHNLDLSRGLDREANAEMPYGYP